MTRERPTSGPRERSAPGPVVLRITRRWSRIVDPIKRRRSGRLIRLAAGNTDRRVAWRSSRRSVLAWILSVTGALLLLLWLLRATIVVFWLRDPLSLPFGFNPDEVCRRVGTSCGALTGFVLPWLSVAAASVIFLSLRLRAVVKPYASRARTKPSELVPTAGTIVGDVVGREELCEVIIDDLRHSDDRRPHILIGGVGTGKTAVLVRLTHLLASSGAVPVPVRLREAQNNELDFQHLASRQFRSEVDEALLAQGESDKTWRHLRKRDRIVILADGLEEALSGENESKDRDNLIRLAIRRARREKLPLVIASRPHDTLREVDAAIFELEPLSGAASLEYLDRSDAAGDRQRLDWIVETADISEAPLYLRITHELHERGLLRHLTDGARARGVNTRSLDRSALRLNLLDTWLWALLQGHLQADVPLTTEERTVTVAYVAALAVAGLKADSLEVAYTQVVEEQSGGERIADPGLRGLVTTVTETVGGRPVPIRLAATWAFRLGLLESRGSAVRFHHSILQAYLASLALDRVIPGEEYLRVALQAPLKPGRELLIALVLMSRRRRGPDVGFGGVSSDNPLTGDDAVDVDVMHAVVAQLRDQACGRQDNKALDMLAAALEIDSVNPRPQHAEIATTVQERWANFTASDPRTLEEAKLGLIRRFGDAVRQIERAPQISAGRAAEPGYAQLFEIGCIESTSYAVRHAVAQELGVSGHGAFCALRDEFDRVRELDGPAVLRDEGDWRRTILCAWLAPLLLGSVDSEAREDGKANLRDWVEHIGGSGGQSSHLPVPLSVEVALAQGFTYAANRRRRHPHAHVEVRGYLVEQANELLKRSGFWAAQLTLLHALTLWALPDDGMVRTSDNGEHHRSGSNQHPDPRIRVNHWLEYAGSKRDTRFEPDRGSVGNRKHPLVKEAAELSLFALQSGQPERFIWVDVFGVTSKIGSRSTGQSGSRKHNLWIPPSVGWSALDPRAQQLVADVLLLINLADRGSSPAEREQRLQRSNRRDLPPCLTRGREPLDPNRAVGGADNSQPGANCVGGCPFELCPYPPKGVQSYRAELSEAFCRRQQTLLGRSRVRRRAAAWQGTLPEDLRRFWADMAHRARR